MGPIHHTTGGEGDSATPPPHHRGEGKEGGEGLAGPGAYMRRFHIVTNEKKNLLDFCQYNLMYLYIKILRTKMLQKILRGLISTTFYLIPEEFITTLLLKINNKF